MLAAGVEVDPASGRQACNLGTPAEVAVQLGDRDDRC
jgi:hypothetical protein